MLFTDILSIIFEDLEQENDNTLYSCIFVNREWCQVAIPFLWKNPWKKFHIPYARSNRYEILFKCLLMMMSRESKEFLKMKGMNFLIEDTLSQNNSAPLQTPLFNYASFCKVIDSFKINDMVKHNLITPAIDYHHFVEQEILKLLISNTSKLKILKLKYRSHPIAFFPNSSISLTQLNELHCDTSIDTAIFYELSQLCKNIERLVIERRNDDNPGLIVFIKQQINLRSVKLWEDFRYKFIAQGQCKKLGEALATKTTNIIELDIGDSVIIPPLLLKKFQNNLTIFKFGMDYDWAEVGLINELENILRNISLPNLQQLIVYKGCPYDVIANIVKKTNGELKKINIEAYHFNEGNDILFSTIAKHCPKLESLNVFADGDLNLNEISELIRGCKKLRGLVLQSFNPKQNIGELFKILYNNASDRLRKLQLDGDWELSKEVLNEFFENWNQKQSNSLDFYITSNRSKDEYVDIIKKYQELGVIRKFEKYSNYKNYVFLDSWV